MTRFVLALLLAGAPALADEKGAPAPAAAASDVPQLAFERSALDNGLDVLFHQDKRLPQVCVSVWYHAGAFNEDAGKTGFAHLFEHLMFQGSKHVTGDNHFKLLEAAGGTYMNGTTDFDRTNYFECVPKNEVELALWLEADRMGWLMEGVDKAKLDEQRNVVKNERRQSIENAPYGLAEEKLWQSIFPKEHPYYGDVIGSMADLDKASLDDVRKFYDTYYAPSNATLAVAGDIESADAKKLVEKYFKTLPKWPKPAAKTVKAPTLDKEVRVDFEDPVAQLAKVEVFFFTPPAYQPGDADVAVLARILGDGNASRLHQALIVDAQLAQDVSAEVQSLSNVSVMSLSATVRPGVDPETVLNAIQSQIELLGDLTPDAADIARVVNTIESDRVFSLQLTLERAELLQNYNHFVGDPGYLEKDIARFRAVTPDTVGAALKQYMAKEHRAVLVVRPKGAAPTAPDAKPDAKPADGGAK